MPQRGEFRATTDTMLDIIDQLRRAEEQKQQVQVGSPEFLLSAKKAEELSRLAYRWAGMQLAMALDTQHRIAEGKIDGDVRLITVEPRPLDRLLAHWREAQFRLEIAGLGSPEAEAATRDIERLRDEYQVGFQAKQQGHADALGETQADGIQGNLGVLPEPETFGA
jgi:hypothetical protein